MKGKEILKKYCHDFNEALFDLAIYAEVFRLGEHTFDLDIFINHIYKVRLTLNSYLIDEAEDVFSARMGRIISDAIAKKIYEHISQPNNE